MHGPINVKSPNNTSKWQMGFNSAFKVLTRKPPHFEVRRIRRTDCLTISWVVTGSGVTSAVTSHFCHPSCVQTVQWFRLRKLSTCSRSGKLIPADDELIVEF
jgi:hypothetical protein